MNGKRAIVIGGAGFLGSHLTDHLIETGNEVLVLDNLIAGRRDFVNPRARFLWCDITHSEAALAKIFKGYDYVFNYAASPYVPDSFERPLHVFDINARGALMVINAAQEASVRVVLQISSAEIYGDAMGVVNESHPAHPHSTYGAAKLAIDSIVQTRWQEAGCRAISLRQFNCLGERDVLHPYVVPEIYRQILKGDVVHLGNNSFRDFIYVGDAVRMAVELVEKGEFGEVYNLGAQGGIKIYDLAVMIGKIMGKDVKVEDEDWRKRPWEIWHLQADNSKLYKVIEARPEVTLEDAVRRTITYYQENPDKWGF